ncbi:hypothetical protein FOZ60_004097 [Perkinsus olseni]|uniref:Uncharacterized protein n=1 Tax=Perkinsus olseni TaxID=32597 RepID=A0A7J6PJ73_PEROL|nr:hypothetical protein FOZ60_004097 [Perkinsus olseni]
MAPAEGSRYSEADVQEIFKLPPKPRGGGEVVVNLERIANTLLSHMMARDLLLRERRSLIQIDDVDRLLDDLEVIGCLPRPVEERQRAQVDSSTTMGQSPRQ